MFKFSQASKERLWGVDSRLQEVANLAIQRTCIDFGIGYLGGLRTASEQAELYRKKKTKLDGVTKKSKHQEGLAMDVVAYVRGKPQWDKLYYYMLAGVILSTAKELGVRLRWGGDWDGDREFDDQTFHDLGHFELVLC